MSVKSALEIIKNDQANQNKASEDMMTAIKENAENIESKHKLVFAMFFWVVIALVMLAVVAIDEYVAHALSILSVLQDGTEML